MYAVIKTGGKQYKVSNGTVLQVEKLDAVVGDTVEISDVLLLVDGEDVKYGAPLIEGAKVTAEVVEHNRGKKIQIVKFKRRKHYHKKTGHRQYYTKLKISSIA